MSLRLVVALALACSAVLTVVCLEQLRSLEAFLLAGWLDLVQTGGVTSQGPYFVIQLADGQTQAFEVTVECSVVVILAPLLLVAAALCISRKVSIVRILAAVAAMIAAVLVANQVRLASISWASHLWGMDVGYEVSHRFVGSIIGIAGFVAGVAVLLLAVGLGNRRGRGASADDGAHAAARSATSG